MAERDPKTLPVFKVSSTLADLQSLAGRGERIFGLTDYETQRVDDRLSLRSGHPLVEQHLASGGIWAADRSRLWNTNVSPTLPTRESVRELADRFLADRELLPRLDGS